MGRDGVCILVEADDGDRIGNKSRSNRAIANQGRRLCRRPRRAQPGLGVARGERDLCVAGHDDADQCGQHIE